MSDYHVDRDWCSENPDEAARELEFQYHKVAELEGTLKATETERDRLKACWEEEQRAEADLRDMLEKAKAERDALAAHSEKVRGYLVGYSQLLREKAATFGGYTEADISHRSNYCREAHDVDEAYGSSPVTSLARLKAQSYAEALENAAADGLQAEAVDELVDMLRKRSTACRRQAEGGTHDTPQESS